MKDRKQIVDHFIASLMANAAIAESLDTSFLLEISGDGGGTWQFICKQPFRVEEGSSAEGRGTADCTISLSSLDLHDILQGQLNPQAAFVTGRISVSGRVEEALKFPILLETFVGEGR